MVAVAPDGTEGACVTDGAGGRWAVMLPGDPMDAVWGRASPGLGVSGAAPGLKGNEYLAGLRPQVDNRRGTLPGKEAMDPLSGRGMR